MTFRSEKSSASVGIKISMRVFSLKIIHIVILILIDNTLRECRTNAAVIALRLRSVV